MKIFHASSTPYAVAAVIVGLLALGPMAVILAELDWRAGIDAFAALMLLAALPLAIAGVLAILGGVFILRRKPSGRVLATVGIAIAALYPLIWNVFALMNVHACGPEAGDCTQRWLGIAAGLGSAAVLGYLIAALWIAKKPKRRRR